MGDYIIIPQTCEEFVIFANNNLVFQTPDSLKEGEEFQTTLELFQDKYGFKRKYGVIMKVKNGILKVDRPSKHLVTYEVNNDSNN